MRYPSPADEIRIRSIRTLHGPNFWSRRPITRLDLTIGAYEEISSADVPGFASALQTALPGLYDHRCSVGEPGGFIERLRRGTYAPHIIEHVGLELQQAVGYGVGFGRARGGDESGEYTVVFAHQNPGIGERAAVLGVELVQDAFAQELSTAEHAISDLERLLSRTGEPPVSPARGILCGVTGGPQRAEVGRAMRRRGVPASTEIVDVSPADILNRGLPYDSSTVAVILDALPTDVPPRYREGHRARQLVTVLADCVPAGGVVVVPAADRALIELIRSENRIPAGFSVDDGNPRFDEREALFAVALVREGSIVIRREGEEFDLGPHDANAPVADVAAALAAHVLTHPRSIPAALDGEPGATIPG